MKRTLGDSFHSRMISAQAGQLTIEMILLTLVMLGVALTISNEAKKYGLVASLVEGPWQPMQGMIENGVWKNSADAKAYHPGGIARHGTRQN
jgi:hypothetical protein